MEPTKPAQLTYETQLKQFADKCLGLENNQETQIQNPSIGWLTNEALEELFSIFKLIIKEEMEEYITSTKSKTDTTTDNDALTKEQASIKKIQKLWASQTNQLTREINRVVLEYKQHGPAQDNTDGTEALLYSKKLQMAVKLLVLSHLNQYYLTMALENDNENITTMATKFWTYYAKKIQAIKHEQNEITKMIADSRLAPQPSTHSFRRSSSADSISSTSSTSLSFKTAPTSPIISIAQDSPAPSRPASTHSSRRSSVDLIHTPQPGLLYALACDLLLYLVAITVLLPILLFALHTGSSLSPSTLSQTFPYFGQCTDAIQNLTDKNIFTGLSISAVLAVLATLILSDEYTPIHPKITPRYLSTKSAAKKAGAIGILAAGIFLFITMGIVMVSDVLVVASDLKLSQMEMFLTVVTGASFAVFLVHRAVTAFKNATSQRPSVERVVHLSVFVLTTMLCLFMITACVAKFNSEAVTVFPAVKQAACDLFTFEEDPPTLWSVASSWGSWILNPFNGSAAVSAPTAAV
ncbi:hypothetical protein NEDG_01620 [Nematocida displodere]|uniref:Uncharacterized protein n=1 Tax=Nematocida displodere TaxID=1805483 RepID=A0A177EGY2_9MICR|nr:hypothetical protein NEDG_01620 [Nematocida displodere]